MKKSIHSAIIVFSLFAGSAALADAPLHVGEFPIPAVDEEIAQLPALDVLSRREIARVLEAESRTTTVSDAMAIKRSGLAYVRDISDFEYLCSFTTPRPSEAYRRAVGDFIASHVGRYVRGPYDMRYLRVLEARTQLVSQAMKVKTAGLVAVRSVHDFLELLPFSVSNPSEAYRVAVSSFVAQHVRSALDRYSPIYLIVEVEKFTKTVTDAMAVKNAGLVAVHSKSDLLDLARYSTNNPSAAYRQAVSNFIRANIDRFPPR